MKFSPFLVSSHLRQKTQMIQVGSNLKTSFPRPSFYVTRKFYAIR